MDSNMSNNRLDGKKGMMFDVHPVFGSGSSPRQILITSRNCGGLHEHPKSTTQVDGHWQAISVNFDFQDDFMDKLYRRYIGTRDHLSASDAACVAKFSQDSQVELAQIERAMDATYREVDALFEKFAKLAARAVAREHHLKLMGNLVAPIRTLPPEILATIFRTCLPPNESSHYGLKPTGLLLGQVCRSWRDAAHHDPFLWRSHGITIPNQQGVHSASFANRIALLDMCRIRSRNLPRSLCIYDLTEPLQDYEDRPFEHSQIMDMLLFAFREYEHLSFRGYSKTWHNYLLDNEDRIDRTTFQKLTSLSLTSTLRPATSPELVVFSDVPNLHKVELIVGQAESALPIRLPMALRCLEYRVKADRLELLTGVSTADKVWRHLLRMHVHLEEATLDVSTRVAGSVYLNPLVQSTPVHSKALRKVTIRCSLLGDVTCLLRGVLLPNIKTFTFKAGGRCLLVPAHTSNNFHQQILNVGIMYLDISEALPSFKELTSLTLIRVFALKSDIKPIFEEMTSLETLQIFLASDCSTRDAHGAALNTHSTAEDLWFIKQLVEPLTRQSTAKEYMMPKLSKLTVYYKCHLDFAEKETRVRAYSKLLDIRSQWLSWPGGFDFTLLFSKEHNMIVDLPWVMNAIRASCSHVSRLSVQHNIIDTFESMAD